jgi:hypothetical protein
MKFIRTIEFSTQVEKKRTVRAHDAGDIRGYGSQERMKIDFVECLVINVGTRSGAIVLLLVPDIVLGTGLNPLALDTYDGLIRGFPSEIWIGT